MQSSHYEETEDRCNRILFSVFHFCHENIHLVLLKQGNKNAE